MPHIRSANPDFKRLDAPSRDPGYTHGADRRQRGIPVAFQVTSPFDYNRVLLPHALVLHVNPANFNETHTKKVERFQTKGGWVEQHWGDELSEISADGSTGAFMNIYTGLSSVLRRRTIAYDRFRDLYDLFRHNGSVYDPYGNIVLQGQIMLMFDRGTFIGTFRTFEFEETAESPFAFTVNWTFKVERILYYIPGTPGQPLYGPAARAPAFQSQNTVKAPNAVAATEKQDALDKQAAANAAGTALGGAIVGGIRGLLDGAAGVLGIQTATSKAKLAADRQEQMRQAIGAPSQAEQRALDAKQEAAAARVGVDEPPSNPTAKSGRVSTPSGGGSSVPTTQAPKTPTPKAPDPAKGPGKSVFGNQ